MKKPFIPLVIAAAICAIATEHAGAKPKPGAAAKREAVEAITSPNASEPAEALAPYINQVDQLLALERPKRPMTKLLEQAPGRIANLQREFTAEKSRAEKAQRPKFDAAVATCETLLAALDERQKTLGAIQSSSANVNSGKLEAPPRKDRLDQGSTGGGRAKAAATIAEYKREGAEKREGRKRAAQGDAALTAMSVNRWNQRSIELRKRITDAYARIGK